MFSIGKWRGRFPVRGCEGMPENGVTCKEAATGTILQEKGVPINFAKFTGKHLCQSLFFLFFMFTCEFCEITKKTFSTEHHSRNRSRSSYGRCSIKIAVLTLRRFSFRLFHEILI